MDKYVASGCRTPPSRDCVVGELQLTTRAFNPHATAARVSQNSVRAYATVDEALLRRHHVADNSASRGRAASPNAGFAGNDSPSFVFPTAIATKSGPGSAGSGGGSGSGRPAVANKPSFLTGGAGPTGHLSSKRGTEDLDFFIGDEAIAAGSGPGMNSVTSAMLENEER